MTYLKLKLADFLVIKVSDHRYLESLIKIFDKILLKGVKVITAYLTIMCKPDFNI